MDKDSIQESEMQKLLDDKQYFNLPKLGDLVKGTVISAHKNEVHIDLDGVATGLVRGKECYSESEEYRNLKLGDEVSATVLELENENGEIELSFRYAGRQKAWREINGKMEVGDVVKVVVLDANKGGLMIKYDTVQGFLPVSQLAPEHYPRVPGGDKNHILEILKGYVGQQFDAKIIDANEEEEKLIISEKAAWLETQKEVMDKYKIGNVVNGTITAVTDFGAFVEFDDKLEGLVHISEIAWQRIDNPHDFLKVGQAVKTEIIGIDGSKIFLSIKKLQKDPWHDVAEKYKIGQKVTGKVIKANPFGLFVELDQDIHGLAHISQLSTKPVKDISEIGKVGDVKDLYVISIEPAKHRLGLSLLEPKAKAEKPATDTKKAADEKEPTEDKEEKKEEKTEKKKKKAKTKKEEKAEKKKVKKEKKKKEEEKEKTEEEKK
jgi:small subunit ribosomal protein S1